jgi:photosystem II stability/assembly factor-like uncharacterized protein
MAETPKQPSASSTQLPPWVTRYNHPGLSELIYRGGRYSRALSEMLEQLPSQTVNGTSQPPLARLNTDANNDWTLALVRSWAAVTDVLGFYQERIVNEGYIRTATERRSVLELARAIGYELRPGVAASTNLAFTVLTTKDKPSYQVAVPAGTAVQSVPAPGEQSQTFETSASLTARSEWNGLRPTLAPASIWNARSDQKITSARLISANTGLRVDDMILVVGDPRQPDASEPPWLLAALKTVQPFPDQGYTLVTWEAPLFLTGNGAFNSPQAFVIRQQAALFGYSPASILARSMLSGEGGGERWAPVAIGLPQAGINALLGTQQGALFAGTGQGLYRSINRGETWEPVSVSLVSKSVQSLALDQQGHLVAGMDDGHIYRSKDGGEKWAALNGEEVVLPPRGLAKLWSRGKTPLSKTVVRSLAAYSRGRKRILAAATDEGVFKSKDRGKSWLPANKDLPKTDPKTGLASIVNWCLTAKGPQKKADLFAGTDAGVFHIREGLNLTLIIAAIAVMAILDFLWREAFLGTIRMLGRCLSRGLSGGLPDPQALSSMSACLRDRPSLITMLPFYLSTALVIVILFVIFKFFIERSLGRRAAVTLGMPVRALVSGWRGQLFAGTGKGVYRSNDGLPESFWRRLGHRLTRALLGDLARRWQPVNTGLTSQDIRSLAVDHQGALLAGTGDGSVFRSHDNGATWQAFGADLSVRPIQALWTGQDQVLAGGLPPKAKVESSWSPFQLEQKRIDLDKTYPFVTSGSWLVLSDAGNTGWQLYQIGQVEAADSLDLLKAGQFTRLTVDRSDRLDRFDRSSALARLQGEGVQLLSSQPADAQLITFDGYVSGLEGGQKLAVSGKRVRARLLCQDGEVLKLILDGGLRSIDIDREEPYQVLGLSPTGGPRPAATLWLKTRTGQVGSVTLPLEQVLFEPAADNDEVVSEVVEIDEIREDLSRRTVVSLRQSLANLYDGPTMTINGNVVHATHGKTIAGERLGSSSGLAAPQRFRLDHSPVTYLGASSGSGLESTVKVEIDGVRWQEVSSFERLDHDRRVFMLQQDEQGNTTVLFGFGQQGTGIPVGAEQIRATYRQGLGSAGNVAAGSLHVLQNALPGLKAVSNPLAASGGADPETMTDAQQKAPRSVRAMERIVSLSDYQDFSRQFDGIGRAQARLLSRGHLHWLHITIADSAGNEVPETSELFKNLGAAIESSRISLTPPVHLASYERIYFRLKATLLVDPAYFAHAAQIKQRAEAALQAAFTFAQREFGQAVNAAEILKLIHGIPGITAVELEQLYRDGQEAERNISLEAREARWEGERLCAAEMLVIRPIDGIELNVEAAP